MWDGRSRTARTEQWDAASDIAAHVALFVAFFWMVVFASAFTAADQGVVIALYLIGLYGYELGRVRWWSYVGASDPSTVGEFKRLCAKWLVFLPLAVLAVNTVVILVLWWVVSQPWAHTVPVVATVATAPTWTSVTGLAALVVRTFLWFLLFGNVVAFLLYSLGFARA